MKTAFCTISTQSHIFQAKALLGSIAGKTSADLFCLLTDTELRPDTTFGEIYHTLGSLESNLPEKIVDKYRGDKLRWALKPVLLKHLLESGYDAVIYCDNDIFFYSSPDFLFEKLGSSSFLLTPHFYPADPRTEQNWLEANFRVGLYNAGFIGVSKAGIPMLGWWTECCMYNVKKSFRRGLFDDQKYLDLVPVIFENVEVIKHRGCNLAGWNYRNYRILRNEEGTVVLDEQFPVVFIHFAELSMQLFSDPENPLHGPYLDYIRQLRIFKPGFQEKKGKTISGRNIRAYLGYIRWKIARLTE